MNRATRDKFVSGTPQDDLTTGKACWETPPAIYTQLAADFGPFDVDLTADADRHCCPMWFGPDSPDRQFDARTAPWHAYGRCGFSNPPYGHFVATILQKAAAEARSGFTSVLLLPMRVTKAFHTHVLTGASELLFCDKRIMFFEHGAPRLNPKTGKPDTALFDSIVVIFRPPGYAVAIQHTTPALIARSWRVPRHVFPADIERAHRVNADVARYDTQSLEGN